MPNVDLSGGGDVFLTAHPGSSYPVPSESALDYLMVEQSSSADETGEDLQPNEPASKNTNTIELKLLTDHS